MIGQGDGSYTIKGTFFSMPGRWQVQAVVRRPNKFDAYANFNFMVPQPGQSSEAAGIPRVAGGLFLGMGLIVALLAVVLPTRPINRFAFGALPFLVLVSIGWYFLTIPVKATASQANPIAPNSTSIGAGKAVYTKYCEHCHGVTGKGDGPDGLLLNPRPADLTLHGVPGVHTDAQLYDWITNGLPGTRMQALERYHFRHGSLEPGQRYPLPGPGCATTLRKVRLFQKYPFIIFMAMALLLDGCTVNIGQQNNTATSTSTGMNGSTMPTMITGSGWSNLHLTGKLIFVVETSDATNVFMEVEELDLGTGGTHDNI